MIGSNIKYYRLQNKYSIRELARKCHLSPMAISYYENNLRRPSNNNIKIIASALNKDVIDFLTTYDTTSNNIIYEDYYLNKLSKIDKEYIDVQINDCISRLNQVLRFSSIENKFIQKIDEKKLIFTSDYKLNSNKLRSYLGINTLGPLELIKYLELNKIICVPIKFNSSFYVCTGKTNNLRYIAYNLNQSKEIIYKHIFYLLIELYFQNLNDFHSDIIKRTYYSFIYPKQDTFLLLKNSNDITIYEKIRKTYYLNVKDFYHYLKILNIYNLEIKSEDSFIQVEKPLLLITLLDQLKNNKYIDEKKYNELIKDNI